MPYLLTHDESIPRGLRRIAREEIDSAIAHLRVKEPAKRDEAIHEARKNIKKLRGLVRLLMPCLGKGGRRENTALRDLGRTLSEVRDAAALIETVDLLGKKYQEDAAITRLASVRSAMVRRRNAARRQADASATGEAGITALRGLRRRLNSWEIGVDFALIAPGLKATYKRGRQAMARASRHSGADSLHELRKRVKDYWYQVRLLEGIFEPDQSPENALKDLQEWLGDAHNLAVLREKAGAEFEGLTPLIDEFEKELRHKSLAAAKELYAMKSRAHVGRLAELWEKKRGGAARKSAKNTEARSAKATSAA